MSQTILFFRTAPVESFSSETKNVNKEVFHSCASKAKGQKEDDSICFLSCEIMAIIIPFRKKLQEVTCQLPLISLSKIIHMIMHD